MSIATNPYYSKTSIRERMYQSVAAVFGVSRTELLDPVVLLFLEALAEEIYKTATEIDNVENRLLSGLSSVLVPDTGTVAAPAHTVLQATPAESSVDISTHTEFYHSRGSQTFSFYPVCDTKILKGDIRYFISNGTLYDNANRLPIANGRKDTGLRNSFWMGLELDENIETLFGLSFYFHFRDIQNKEKQVNLLPHTLWKIQGQSLIMKQGLFAVDEECKNDVSIFVSRDFSHKINTDVKNACESSFLHTAENIDIRDKREVFPSALEKVFPAESIASFDKSLLWIEVVCPPEFTPEVIQTLQISINAFPVVNKCLISQTAKINRAVPVIPLDTGKNESFLSVHSLTDAGGRKYYDVPPANDKENSAYGVYSLRRGGCERYDFRDAEEYLDVLIHSLQREVASFYKNEVDNDIDMKRLGKEADELLKHLKKAANENKKQYEIKQYILTNPEKDSEIYFAEYWITCGAAANDIRAGARFFCTEKVLNVVSLLPVQGGKSSPAPSEKNNLYKAALSKGSMLVTDSDISDFCETYFHHFFRSAKVRKGLIKSETSGIGFLRTTDVYLQPCEGLEEKIYRQEAVLVEAALKANSPATYRYQIFITDK
ncbi:hypothetical protein FACS18945_5530 [Bacteroidia bacterium]|nr:hypothetical protein FACS18945_5530 [Bacteroidia bacterium]